MRFLTALVLNGLLIYAAGMVFTGIEITSYLDAVVVALVLALVNVLVRPILLLLTLPLTILTMGLFLLVVNGAMILLTDWLLPDFWVDGWFWAIVLSIIMSIFNLIIGGTSEPKPSAP
jgi:putative membrane protein